jgi:CBS domain-containing protein
LITATDQSKVSDILELMRKNKIISVPILRETGGPFDGIIDLLDLVTYCTAKFSIVSLLAPESYRQMEEFCNQPVKDLLDVSGRNAWVWISQEEPLKCLIQLLSKHHRVAIVNDKYDVIQILTQSKLVEFLYKNRRFFPEAMHQRVDNLQKPVECINQKEFVMEAFKRIWDKEVSGLAVVNDDGVLTGNISASDLLKTHVEPIGEMIHDLYRPVKDFLGIRESLKDKIMMAEIPECKPIAVSPNDTLQSSIEKCLQNKIHRVFIEDDKMKPVGVISLGDIIHQFVPK